MTELSPAISPHTLTKMPNRIRTRLQASRQKKKPQAVNLRVWFKEEWI
jgi:hypothetical protein